MDSRAGLSRPGRMTRVATAIFGSANRAAPHQLLGGAKPKGFCIFARIFSSSNSSSSSYSANGGRCRRPALSMGVFWKPERFLNFNVQIS